MEDNGKVIEIRSRLRDGRAIKTEEDFQQWLYEYFDKISREFGTYNDYVPHEIFPSIIRMMVERVEAIRGNPELDLETAECLADAVKDLTDCQKKCIEMALKSIGEERRPPH